MINKYLGFVKNILSPSSDIRLDTLTWLRRLVSEV